MEPIKGEILVKNLAVPKMSMRFRHFEAFWGQVWRLFIVKKLSLGSYKICGLCLSATLPRKTGVMLCNGAVIVPPTRAKTEALAHMILFFLTTDVYGISFHCTASLSYKLQLEQLEEFVFNNEATPGLPGHAGVGVGSFRLVQVIPALYTYETRKKCTSRFPNSYFWGVLYDPSDIATCRLSSLSHPTRLVTIFICGVGWRV